MGSSKISHEILIGSERDYFYVNEFGEARFSGKGTTFEDISTSLIGRRLFGTVGGVDYDYEENSVVFQNSGDISDINDCVVWSIQLPHKVNDSFIYPHVHFEQESLTDVEFTLWYRIQESGKPKDTVWKELTATWPIACLYTHQGHSIRSCLLIR